jgi:hypothetical protein
MPSSALNGLNTQGLHEAVAARLLEQDKIVLKKLLRSVNIFGLQTGGIEGKSCMYCKSSQYEHAAYSDTYSDGHPFFCDNLEYLEWLDAKKQNKV